jgi:hypothetical protein
MAIHGVRDRSARKHYDRHGRRMTSADKTPTRAICGFSSWNFASFEIVDHEKVFPLGNSGSRPRDGNR